MCFSQNAFDKLCQIIKSKPQIHLSIINDKIQIINIYKQQILSVSKSRNLVRKEGISLYVGDVYSPHSIFWNNFFDETGFRNWAGKNWNNFKDPKFPGLLIPFIVDFDSVFIETVIKLKNITSREPIGKWYLVYGNRAAGMGGFGNGIMFIDFFGIGDNGDEHLIFTLPHEINHQIFGGSNINDGTLLYSIIDEGFSCYVNYIYWGDKFSRAKNINFTDEEWNWCIKNERKLLDYSKPLFYSKDKNVIHKFQRGNKHIWEGAPDRIAYFIGFRICEIFVNNNGKDSWKNIYDLPISKTFNLSGYENFINK